jgi:ParB family chromosome partitioning protein
VKQQVNKGLLDMGHARALLALIRHDQIEVARLVVNRGLSVRETELLVKKTLAAQDTSEAKPASADPDVKRLEDQISEKLGAGVKIKPGKKGSGQLIISFHSSAEFDGILEHLSL